MHDRQQGFRKNKSSESTISETVNYIEKHTNDEDAIGVFLDIQAAFETIQPLAIKQALHNHNLDDKLVDWYCSHTIDSSSARSFESRPLIHHGHLFTLDDIKEIPHSTARTILTRPYIVMSIDQV